MVGVGTVIIDGLAVTVLRADMSANLIVTALRESAKRDFWMSWGFEETMSVYLWTQLGRKQWSGADRTRMHL